MTTSSAIPEPEPASAPARTGAPRHKPAASNASGTAAPANRRLGRAATTDPLSDRATQALVRKVLLPQESGDKGRDSQTPIDELLPPLTSRNDVDLQLYALLAIILRESVQSWYNKITPDETFVAEIIHVIAHCTRALEQRLRTLDLENLLLHEVPEILDKHITTYRSTHPDQSLQPVYIDGREAYHALWPLPLLSPVPIPGDPITTPKQLGNEAAYRQLLVQAVLTVLLPTEDLENPCLTALVGQIFSELVIGNAIANKAVQPWMLFEAICIIERVLAEKRRESDALKASSGAKVPLKGPRSWSAQGFFVSIVQFVFLSISMIRFAFTLITMSFSLPSRGTEATGMKTAPEASFVGENAPRDTRLPPAKVPVLLFNAWSCLGNMIELHTRMPWFGGFLSLLQLGVVHGPGRVAGLDGVLDRLLSHHIQFLFSASHLPPLLRTLRGALFPNNAPGSSSMFPPSSHEELRALRRRAARALWNMAPRCVGRLYFGGGLGAVLGELSETAEEDMVNEMEGLLEVLGDEYCNKHLVYSVLELILVRLVPELTESGVDDLLQERLG
ncbi:Protein mss51, mitochondrial [Metarhizium rileyi]|uniref:Protein mss51, mitochondrial n=1 Tax=Metarhizium rileyi (strain RCEF 4871) TaxID=1649241 RepID=A0A5C6G7Y9_METRR|nr:Protein mss51, mitochondrial [Metarhizium rileyi]